MLAELTPVENQNPESTVADDEILVVLGPVNKAKAGWVEELRSRALESLSQDHYYTRFHCGFLADQGKKPFVLLEWLRSGTTSLERRWVASHLAALLRQRFNLNQLAVFLEDGSGPEQLAIAEDLFTAATTPRYEENKWQSRRILACSPHALNADDLHRDARQRRQLDYRRWINENPDELTSLEIGRRLEAFSGEHGLSFETLAESELEELGMNLLLAVGQASERSPSRLHLVTHNLEAGEKPLLLIGKGITFDTGGINLKPHERFVNRMKNDMGGAALMANLFMALVESGYKGPLALAVPTCENLIDGKAMKPGSILTSHSGTKVMIEHTDAEGRLILADTISYAQKRLDPRMTFTAATLTTSALWQFSNFYTPVHFATAGLKQMLEESAAMWGEAYTFWSEFLPFAKGNQTNAADLTNMGRMAADASGGGGSNVAAHFLKSFSNGPLVHFDIFASAWNWSGDYPGAHYGATGAPFNSLFQTLAAGGTDVFTE